MCMLFQGGRKSLADKYEYVMHGKLYKISDEGSGKHLKAYVHILKTLYDYDPSMAVIF